MKKEISFKMSDYVHYLIRTEFNSIYEYSEILEEYQKITGFNFQNLDNTMIELIRKHKPQSIKLYHVNSKLLPYVEIERNLGYDQIKFNQQKYKIELIKKLLTSENENLLSLIEAVIFSDFQNIILSDEEYLFRFSNNS